MPESKSMFVDQKKKIAQFRQVFITFKRTMSLSSYDHYSQLNSFSFIMENMGFPKYSECNVHIFTVCNVVAARLCFHRHLPLRSRGAWQTPPGQTPPIGRQPLGRHPLPGFPLGLETWKNGKAFSSLQRSCSKVMFSQASATPFTGGVADTPWADTPHRQTAPGQTPPARVPTRTGNLEKWEGIFQSGKIKGILNRLEKSGKITQNTGKLREFETNII